MLKSYSGFGFGLFDLEKICFWLLPFFCKNCLVSFWFRAIGKGGVDVAKPDVWLAATPKKRGYF